MKIIVLNGENTRMGVNVEAFTFMEEIKAEWGTFVRIHFQGGRFIDVPNVTVEDLVKELSKLG